jgi:hypothetical protein
LADADELTELFAALALAVWALDIGRRGRSPARPPTVLGNATLLVLVVLLTVPFVVLFPDRDILPIEINRFAAIEYPRLRLYPQALDVFEHVERHPELANEVGRFRYGLLLRYTGDAAGAQRILEGVLGGREQALSTARDGPAAHLDVAEALLALGRKEDARASIDRAREIARRAVESAATGDARATALVWLGVAELMEGDAAAAQTSFASAREVGASDREARRLEDRVQTWTRRRAVLEAQPKDWR